MKKMKIRFGVAVLVSLLLGILSLLLGGVIAEYAEIFESRVIGFVASSLPFLALIISFLISKMLLKKQEPVKEKSSFAPPTIWETLLTGAVTAAAILIAFPLRFWSEKLFAFFDYSPINDYLLMNSLIEAGFFLLIIRPLFSELLNRNVLQKVAEDLFSERKLALVLTICYPLTFPRLESILSDMTIGLLLFLLYKATKRHFLCYISFLTVQFAYFIYFIVLSYGNPAGGAMNAVALGGLSLIFFSTATAVLAVVYCVLKKKKPRWIDIGAALLTLVFFLFIGIMLVGS